MHIYWPIGRIVKVLANGPEDLGFIPDRIIPNTQKMVLDVSLLYTQHYKIRINGKWSNPGKDVAPSPTSQCCSYWKGTFCIALDYGQPTYLY